MIGRPAFRNYSIFVHTVSHELEHLHQIREGITDEHLSEFLSEAVELIGKDLPRVEIIDFFASAKEALEEWNQIKSDDQLQFWDRFEEVRERVIKELMRVDFNEFQETIDGYQAVKKPEPADY